MDWLDLLLRGLESGRDSFERAEDRQSSLDELLFSIEAQKDIAESESRDRLAEIALQNEGRIDLQKLMGIQETDLQEMIQGAETDRQNARLAFEGERLGLEEDQFNYNRLVNERGYNDLKNEYAAGAGTGWKSLVSQGANAYLPGLIYGDDLTPEIRNLLGNDPQAMLRMQNAIDAHKIIAGIRNRYGTLNDSQNPISFTDFQDFTAQASGHVDFARNLLIPYFNEEGGLNSDIFGKINPRHQTKLLNMIVNMQGGINKLESLFGESENYGENFGFHHPQGQSFLGENDLISSNNLTTKPRDPNQFGTGQSISNESYKITPGPMPENPYIIELDENFGNTSNRNPFPFYKPRIDLFENLRQ